MADAALRGAATSSGVARARVPRAAAALAASALAACSAQAAPSTPGELNVAEVPAPYRSIVIAAGERCADVSSPLIAAQIDAESGWDPDAVSSAGAEGISQFMPSTWVTWGVDGNGNGRTSPFEPEDAIPAQAAMMCSLAGTTSRWLDDGVVEGELVDLMLAGYNAGPGSVESYGGVPPFSETLAYIDRIKAGIARFTVAASGTVPAGDVVLPLPPGSYTHADNFGESGSNWDDYHTGDDFSAGCGTPVLAAHDGTVVIDTSQSWAGPQLVQVSTGTDDLTTWYAHMQAVSVAEGAQVAGGQQIGAVGTEGNSTGCHLHFEVHPRNGSIYEDPIDPAQWLIAQGVQP